MHNTSTYNVANFKYYVVQDALYLGDFADCLRRLATTAPTPEDSKRLEAFAVGAEEAELSLHNSFFKKWDISADGAQQLPNTLLYTSYMKRVVATASHEQGLAVLLPCFWVYMHVGKCMLQLRDEIDHQRINSDMNSTKLSNKIRPEQYDAWIDMYGGDDFEREVKEYIEMVDRACHRLQQDDANTTMVTNRDEELRMMKQHFIMSCKLEHMFWDQASTMMEWPI